MRGTDVTQWQLEAAQNFITEFVTHRPALEPEQQFLIRWDEFIRVIAWYGAVRAEGAIRLGAATLDSPGHVGLVEQKPSLKLVPLQET